MQNDRRTYSTHGSASQSIGEPAEAMERGSWNISKDQLRTSRDGGPSILSPHRLSSSGSILPAVTENQLEGKVAVKEHVGMKERETTEVEESHLSGGSAEADAIEAGATIDHQVVTKRPKTKSTKRNMLAAVGKHDVLPLSEPKPPQASDMPEPSRVPSVAPALLDALRDSDDVVGVRQSVAIDAPIFAMARPNKGEIKRQPILRPYTAQHDQMICEGWCWLAKLSGSSIPIRNSKPSEWKRRYCLLERGTLYYHKLHIKDAIDLTDAAVEYQQLTPQSLTGSRLGYIFDLSFSAASGKKDKRSPMRLAVGSVRELQEWEEALTGKLRGAGGVGDAEQEVDADAEVAQVDKRGQVMVLEGGKWRMRDLMLKKVEDSMQLEVGAREKQSAFPLLRSFAEKSELSFKPPSKNSTDQEVLSVASDKEIILLSPEGGDDRCQEWLTNLDREIMLLHDAEDEDDTVAGPPPSVAILQHGSDIQELLNSGFREQERLRKAWADGSVAIPKAKTGDEKPFVIVAIDGGGLKGVLDCVILQRLEEKFPDLLDQVDLVAGTSNGAIISTGLAFGYSSSTARTIMETKGPLIFTHPVSKLKGMSQPRFESAADVRMKNKWLKLVLKETYASKRLKETQKKCLISAFQLDDGADSEERCWRPKTYHNLGGDGDASDVYAHDLVMRSTAAPTYFASYQNHIDGALFDQDPAATALVHTMSPKRLNIPLDKIILLSLGTCRVARFVEGDSHEWGVAQWLPKLTGLLWDGMVMKSGNMCKELLGDRYLRIDPVIKEEISLDEPKEIPRLVSLGKSIDVDEACEWLARHLYQGGTSEEAATSTTAMKD